MASLAAGCGSTGPFRGPSSPPPLPTGDVVALRDLADDLGMVYAQDPRGFVELRLGPDAVVLVPESRRVMVNGESLRLTDPCMRMGDGYAVRARDAELLRGRIRSERLRREPAPAAPATPRRPGRKPLPASWAPAAPERRWRHIVIHHSASDRGNAATLDAFHRHSRGFDSLGYDFVIGNGTRSRDGQVEVGPRWRRQTVGAHTRVRVGDDNYWNRASIGIALVGDFTKRPPTRRQMDALVRLVRALRAHYGIPAGEVLPHRKVKRTICPGPHFPWRELARRIR
ncbi:MAG: peptidoglycan recognition family protein [Planctomycetota bacterium]